MGAKAVPPAKATSLVGAAFERFGERLPERTNKHMAWCTTWSLTTQHEAPEATEAAGGQRLGGIRAREQANHAPASGRNWSVRVDVMTRI
jgi:hypothetical protein